MAYKLGKYEFDSAAQFQAAKRDQLRISRLKKDGRSTAEVARNYKRQVRELDMQFETIVGLDFIKELNRKAFIEEDSLARYMRPTAYRYVDESLYIDELPDEDETHIRMPIRVKPGVNVPLIFRRASMAILGAALLFVIFTFAREAYHDYLSDRNLARIQQMSVQAAEAEAVVTEEPEQAPAEQVQPVQEAEQAVHPTQTYGPNDVNVDRILPQYRALFDMNNDLAGWVAIPETKVNYPVMFVEGDNDYYLAHDFEGNPDKNGLLVMDKRCYRDGTGSHVLIHGHNMKTGFMFGQLKKYKDRAFYEAHPRIYFDTLYEERVYDIIAVCITSVAENANEEFKYYDFIRIDDEDSFHAYVTGALEESLYDTGAEAYYGDELLTLSTCDYTKAEGRLVIIARRHVD